MTIEPVGPLPPTRRPPRSAAALGCRLLLPVLVAAAAADAPAAEPGGFLETLDVRVVNLEVYVTDRDGRPVETLRSVSQMATDEDRREQAMRRLRGFTQQVDAETERLRQLAQASVFALSHLVNGLAALPGRKAVVYLGEGIPMRPGEELYAAFDQFMTRARPDLVDFDNPSSEQRDAAIDMRSAALGALDPGAGAMRGQGRAATSGIHELTAVANAGRVSFYALKTDVGDGGLPPEFAGEMRDLFTPQLQGLRERNLTQSIRAMAEQTGGRAVLGTGVGGLLAEARADLASYYFLGARDPS